MKQEVSYPKSLADIDADWMGYALSFKYPGLKVEAVTPSTVINGTATKARFELRYADMGATDAVPPASLWIKGGFEAHAASQANAYMNEVNFFCDLAPVLPINCPVSYYQSIDEETANGIVLLEDLLLRKATFGHVTSPLTLENVIAVLDEQARYHAYFWEKPELRKFEWLSSGGSILEDGVVDMFIGLWDQAEALPRFGFVRGGLRDRKCVRSALVRMWENTVRDACCLVHGDAHPGNLFFEPDGKPGYLDWQQVMRGAWAHDVASFVIPALPVDFRRRHERELLRHYLDRLSAYGASAPDFDAAWKKYREHAIWTFMWTLCPVAFQPEEICGTVAERACAAIEDLETLAALER